MDRFAVIDIETNWNKEIMSVGVVVANSETKEQLDSIYYVITPEYEVGGMFYWSLNLGEKNTCVASKEEALREIKKWLDKYNVRKLFAYNATFDKRNLPEYSDYEWYDIMRLAAYRQYNRAIPELAEVCKTGRLKRGYSVENIMRLLSKNKYYQETHNAVLDAQDELKIIQLLGHDIQEYNIARVI